MRTKKINVVCCVLVMIATGIHAQNNTITSGGDATGSGGSASYSVGQIDYVSGTGSGGTVTQGNQQPYEIYVTGIDQPNANNISAVVARNPTSDYVVLELDMGNVSAENTYYTISDAEGKLIEKQNVSTANTEINVANLTNGIYFLTVTDNNKQALKSFKILKTK